jgi:two-component system, chemotaxis family, CheB/CheR fusion protein
MGFVLVQHLDPEHESALTQLLGRATPLPVHEVTNNLPVEPNHVYVIPPNTNLGIRDGVLTLRPRPKTRTPHRSIDFFLEALAEDQRERAIGVILSGTATSSSRWTKLPSSNCSQSLCLAIREWRADPAGRGRP